jgi:hypothetical protein
MAQELADLGERCAGAQHLRCGGMALAVGIHRPEAGASSGGGHDL